VRLRSFKLRLADAHVRIVPLTDAAGCPFSGPGVDLRGDAAARALALAAPLIAALHDAEPGVRVRSLAVDLERPRVTATLDPAAAPGAGGSPGPALAPADSLRARVVRLDDGALLRRLIEASGPICDHLARAAAEALARRAAVES
jgi:hypothetical protein